MARKPTRLALLLSAGAEMRQVLRVMNRGQFIRGSRIRDALEHADVALAKYDVDGRGVRRNPATEDA